MSFSTNSPKKERARIAELYASGAKDEAYFAYIHSPFVSETNLSFVEFCEKQERGELRMLGFRERLQKETGGRAPSGGFRFDWVMFVGFVSAFLTYLFFFS